MEVRSRIDIRSIWLFSADIGDDIFSSNISFFDFSRRKKSISHNPPWRNLCKFRSFDADISVGIRLEPRKSNLPRQSLDPRSTTIGNSRIDTKRSSTPLPSRGEMTAGWSSSKVCIYDSKNESEKIYHRRFEKKMHREKVLLKSIIK